MFWYKDFWIITLIIYSSFNFGEVKTSNTKDNAGMKSRLRPTPDPSQATAKTTAEGLRCFSADLLGVF